MGAVLGIVGLFFGYSLLGGVLAIYDASWPVWFGTQAVILHLAWVGTDAIALAFAWIVCVVWAGAFVVAWPPHIPWAGTFPWATALFLLWLLGLVLAIALGSLKNYISQNGFGKALSFGILTVTTWLGLSWGWFVSLILS